MNRSIKYKNKSRVNIFKTSVLSFYKFQLFKPSRKKKNMYTILFRGVNFYVWLLLIQSFSQYISQILLRVIHKSKNTIKVIENKLLF